MNIWNKTLMASAIALALAGCDVGQDRDKQTSGMKKPATTADSSSSPPSGSTSSPPSSGSTSSPSSASSSSSPSSSSTSPSSAASSTDSGSASPGAAGKPGDSASSGSSSDTTLGQKVDDTAITAKVKTALMADSEIKGTSINVTTKQGEVQLSGDVASQEQADKAMEIARGVDGVTGVQNNLKVKAS